MVTHMRYQAHSSSRTAASPLGCHRAVHPWITVATVGITIVSIGFGAVLSLYQSIITGLVPHDIRPGLVSLGEAGSRMMITLTPIAMGSVIAIATPVISFVSAVQLAGLDPAIVAGDGGSFVSLSPALRDDPCRTT